MNYDNDMKGKGKQAKEAKTILMHKWRFLHAESISKKEKSFNIIFCNATGSSVVQAELAPECLLFSDTVTEWDVMWLHHLMTAAVT